MRYVLFVGMAWTIMFFVHWTVYSAISHVYDVVLPWWQGVLGFLASTFILAMAGVRNFHNKFVDAFYYVAATQLGFITIFFGMVLVFHLVHPFIGEYAVEVLSVLLAAGCMLFLYALYEGSRLSVKQYMIPLEGLEKDVKLVHLTDVHVGTVHQKKFLDRVVCATNDLEPDVILMTGDLFDGSAPIHEEMLTPLNNLIAPTYFSTGNHEVYEGLDHVRETIKNLDMQLLESECREDHGLQIIGVNDRQGIPRSITLDSILNGISFDVNRPTILMYHTPVEWDAAKKHGIDLMLSGHTHNGQVFPFTLLVRLFFKYIKGLYQEGAHYLHVSPGTGTWGPPMRLGSKNQITLITLTKKL